MLKRRKAEHKRPHSSIVAVILCINLCSIIVLSAFNYYVFHYISGKAYMESFLSYNERVTNLAFGNIDQQIMQTMLKLPQLYFSPIKENDPLLLPQEELIAGSSEHIRTLSTEMKKIQKSYPYIAGIDIYYEATGTVVTGFDKIHFPANEGLTAKYLPWYDTYKQMDMSRGAVWIKNHVYLMEEPAIIYVNKISMHKWNGKNIVLAIYISPDSFGEYIDQEAGELAIFTRDNQVLYNSGSKELGVELEEMAQQSREPGGSPQKEDAPFSIKEGTEDLMVFHASSPTSGLKYFYCVDSGRFYKDYEVTNHMLLFNFLISIVFNIIMLLVISYYNYRAYRRRVLLLSEKAGIEIGDSERSFDGSLNVLTKEITTLHEAVHSSKGLMFQSAVRSAILDRKVEGAYETLAPYLKGDNTCVVLVSLTEQELEALSVEELQGTYQPETRDYNVLFTTIDKDGLVAVLIFEDGRLEAVRKDFMREMDTHWNSYELVLGRVFPIKKDGIKNSYKSAAEAARYRYIFPQDKYISYDGIDMENRKESGSHLKLFESIKKDINNEDLLDLRSRIEMLVTSFKNGNYTIEYCSSTLRDLVTLFYQVMQQNQLDMWVVFGYDIREYYKKISDIDTFYVWCGDLGEMILKNIRQKKQAVDADVQLQLETLVNQYLEHNISLDLLADQLHIRPDTASRVFRQIMGTGYTDYIKTKKMNRAIELMDEGCSVKEIAERLGYSTPQYFIKVFKEQYGATPYQYKKKREKDAQSSEK